MGKNLTAPTSAAASPTEHEGRPRSALSAVRGDRSADIWEHLNERLEFCQNETGDPYVRRRHSDGANRYQHLKSRKARALLRESCESAGIRLRPSDLREVQELLVDEAMKLPLMTISYRVTAAGDSIVIDLGTESGECVIIQNGQWTVGVCPPDVHFKDTQSMKPLPIPVRNEGDPAHVRLRRFLNLDHVSAFMVYAWMLNLVVTPKGPDSSFPILVLIGPQGSGKSVICRALQELIDPRTTGLQSMATSVREFALMAADAHLLLMDNLRKLPAGVQDWLCMASTGGVYRARELYTDRGLVDVPLQVGLVLNGVHGFIDQPDLADRCVIVLLKGLPDGDRRSESELMDGLRAELPLIYGGLLDDAAGVLAIWDEAIPENPSRMYDFCRLLAALEQVHGVPGGVYQGAFAESVRAASKDSLEENPLIGALFSFVTDLPSEYWSGSPQQLLDVLTEHRARGLRLTSDWPGNAISLSKRLKSLTGLLAKHGVEVEFRRGRERAIVLTRTEAWRDE